MTIEKFAEFIYPISDELTTKQVVGQINRRIGLIKGLKSAPQFLDWWWTSEKSYNSSEQALEQFLEEKTHTP